MLREHFGTDNPRSSVPSRPVEDAPNVQEGDGTRASWRDVGLICRRSSDANDDTDVEHGEGGSSGSNEEQGTTSESVDEEDEPDEGGDRLDDAVCEEGGQRKLVKVL